MPQKNFVEIGCGSIDQPDVQLLNDYKIPFIIFVIFVGPSS